MSFGEIEKQICLNVLLAEKTTRTLPIISESLAKGNFKLTGKALVSFVPKSGYLTNAILSECQSGNLYSSLVLLRSLVEHNFKHLYIYVKSLKDRDDSVGKTYYSQLRGNEDLEAFKKINNFNAKISPEYTKWGTKSDNNTKLENAALQFNISNIFSYLINNSNIEDAVFDKYQKEYISSRISEYSALSSIVHGGPFGELMHNEYVKNKQAFEKKLISVATESSSLHQSLVEATYLFATTVDVECRKYYDEIKKKIVV